MGRPRRDKRVKPPKALAKLLSARVLVIKNGNKTRQHFILPSRVSWCLSSASPTLHLPPSWKTTTSPSLHHAWPVPIRLTDGFRINDQRREDGSLLRMLFLPQTTFLPLATRAAKNILLRRNFVFNQFQHYGIEYDTSEFAGSDVVQLKRALEAGKAPPQLTKPPCFQPEKSGLVTRALSLWTA